MECILNDTVMLEYIVHESFLRFTTTLKGNIPLTIYKDFTPDFKFSKRSYQIFSTFLIK